MIIALVFGNRVLRKMGLREMRKQGVLKYRVMMKILIFFVPSKALFKLHLSSSGVARLFEAWGQAKPMAAPEISYKILKKIIRSNWIFLYLVQWFKFFWTQKIKFCNIKYLFCLPFCYPLFCAARGGRTTRPLLPLARPLLPSEFFQLPFKCITCNWMADRRLMSTDCSHECPESIFFLYFVLTLWRFFL